MESQYLLANEMIQYLKSQIPKTSNDSENRKRMIKVVKKIFNTLPIILDSKRINQDLKDSMFKSKELRGLIDGLTRHDPDNPTSQEVNKQEIILYMIEQVIDYYRSRYQDDKIVIKRIEEFQTLAQDLHERVKIEEEDTEASMMYKIRGKMPYPPVVYREMHYHTALCKQCFKYSLLGNTKEDAIKKIRHVKYCSYHTEWKRFGKTDKERVITQFIETQKPLKPKKVS